MVSHARDRIELLVTGGQTGPVEPADGWNLSWVEPARGLARLHRPGRQELVVVEGGPTDWFVTLAGRRMAVTARGHRERLLAERGQQAAAHRGPADVRATLPGLVLHVLVQAGQVVAPGDPLVTIEAMKMQNEIRAPRAGQVATVAVSVGQTIATGALLVQLVDADP